MSAQVIELVEEYYYSSIKNLLEKGFYVKFDVKSLRYYASDVLTFDEAKELVDSKYNDMDNEDNKEIQISVLTELTRTLIAPLTNESFFIETGYDENKKKFYVKQYIKVLDI